jgi:hypothetical protein
VQFEDKAPASVLIRTFSEMRGRSYDSFIELLKDKEFLQLKIAEISRALHSYLELHPILYNSEWLNDIKPVKCMMESGLKTGNDSAILGAFSRSF